MAMARAQTPMGELASMLRKNNIILKCPGDLNGNSMVPLPWKVKVDHPFQLWAALDFTNSYGFTMKQLGLNRKTMRYIKVF